MRIIYTSKKKSSASVNGGLLYNEATLTDSRQLTPEGWRVPSVSDVVSLLAALGGQAAAGGAMKTADIWTAPNSGATSESKFKALPAGQRNEAGQFSGQLVKTAFWFKNS